MTVSTSEDESRRGPPNVRSTSEIGKPNLLEPEITIAGTCRVTESMDRRVRTFVLFEDGDIIDD